MNNLFMMYASHEEQKEHIIRCMMRGEPIEVVDDFSNAELREIEKEFTRRTGLPCKISQGGSL